MPFSQTQTSVQINTTPQQAIPNLPAGGRAGYLHFVVLNPGTAVCSVVVWDNATAASGTVLSQINIQSAAGFTTVIDYGGGLAFKNGLWVVVTGTGATAQVTWE